VTRALAEKETGVLTAQWNAVDADPDGTLLAEVLDGPATPDAFSTACSLPR
jgi:hypothetical protein